VRDVVGRAAGAYARTERPAWVQQWPGQAVLAASQLHWTHEVEGALRTAEAAEPTATTAADGAPSPLTAVYTKQLSQLDDLVALIRQPGLSAQARLTLGALTVIDVHARDVTKRLLDAGAGLTVGSFEWISQLRYYWRLPQASAAGAGGSGASLTALADATSDTVAPSHERSLPGDLAVAMISAELPYGYEYLGNSGRLVITPLTDR
jgi:dynein heavy chain